MFLAFEVLNDVNKRAGSPEHAHCVRLCTDDDAESRSKRTSFASSKDQSSKSSSTSCFKLTELES